MSDDDSNKTVTPPEEGEGWIVESLKWPKPKTEEKGGDEGEKGGGGGRGRVLRPRNATKT